jgi:hypothetical protein
MHALMPIFFKMMNFEKVTGREQRYQIDWDAPAMEGTVPMTRPQPGSRIRERRPAGAQAFKRRN